MLYVNPTGTHKKRLPSKQACVFVRMQSKPMSYTEIRDEHGSWTLKLVWQRAIRKEMPHLLFKKKKKKYTALSTPLESQFLTSAGVFLKKKRKGLSCLICGLWCVTLICMIDTCTLRHCCIFLQWWRMLHRSQMLLYEISWSVELLQVPNYGLRATRNATSSLLDVWKSCLLFSRFVYLQHKWSL